MKFESLASSSAGNAYIVSDGESRLLLECGIPRNKLLQLSGFSLSKFCGCLVSHEHNDHARATKDLIIDGMRVFMSEGSADRLGLSEKGARIIEAWEQFNLSSFDIVPFTTFHDAAEPLGFLIKSRVDGDVLAFATDTVNLRYRFPGLNILAIEANFDRTILEGSKKLPEKVKRRIENSHMEIDTLCEYLSELDLSECREIHLLHLSDSSSNELKFLERVRRVVPKGIKVRVCKK